MLAFLKLSSLYAKTRRRLESLVGGQASYASVFLIVGNSTLSRISREDLIKDPSSNPFGTNAHVVLEAASSPTTNKRVVVLFKEVNTCTHFAFSRAALSMPFK
jgi:hypothetical protein